MPDGTVMLVEMFGPRLTRVHPDGTKETIAEIPGGPNGAALGPGGLVYVCNNGGRFTETELDGLTFPGRVHQGQLHRWAHPDRRPGNGKVADLYTECNGKPLLGAQRSGLRCPRRLLLHRPRPRRRRGACPPPVRHLLRQGRWLGDPRGRVPGPRSERHRPVARRHEAVLGRDLAGRILQRDIVAPGELAERPRRHVAVPVRLPRAPVARLAGGRRRRATCASRPS